LITVPSAIKFGPESFATLSREIAGFVFLAIRRDICTPHPDCCVTAAESLRDFG